MPTPQQQQPKKGPNRFGNKDRTVLYTLKGFPTPPPPPPPNKKRPNPTPLEFSQRGGRHPHPLFSRASDPNIRKYLGAVVLLDKWINVVWVVVVERVGKGGEIERGFTMRFCWGWGVDMCVS